MHLIGNLVKTVDCLKYGSQRPADGNIEAVRLPVEVVADRPPEIVEIRNVIPHFLPDRLQFMRGADHTMSRAYQLLHQLVLTLHYIDHCRHIVGLLEQVVYTVFLKLHSLYLAGALQAKQKRYRSVLNRCSL